MACKGVISGSNWPFTLVWNHFGAKLPCLWDCINFVQNLTLTVPEQNCSIKAVDPTEK